MSERDLHNYRFFKEFWAAPEQPRLRLRVNDPEISTHPEFGSRPEATANGLALIDIPEDVRHAVGAELVLELWGGHPWTERKRVTLNGHHTYSLPADGTDQGHCSYTFPRVPVRVSDLVRGTNVLQFACERGRGFWGHFIVDSIAVRVYFDSEHVASSLAADHPVVTASSDGTRVELELTDPDLAERVDYHAAYLGYAVDGAARPLRYGYFGWTKDRLPYNHLGSVSSPPFTQSLCLGSWLPQPSPALTGAVILAADGMKSWVPGPSVYTSLDHPPGVLLGSERMPVPFWSRDGRPQTVKINVPDQLLDDAHEARLHMRFWNGGAGTVDDPVRLNDSPIGFDLSGDPHDLSYQSVSLPLELLKIGANELTVLSDSEDHGIEVLLPGPAIEVR